MLVDPFRPEAGRIRPGDLFARAMRNVTAIPLALRRKLLVRQGIWNLPLGEAAPQTGHFART